MSQTIDIQAKFSGVLQASEGAVFSYLADDGIGEAIIPTGNQADPSRYPTSQRTISRIWACVPLGGDPGGDVTFTLYKNGAITAMTCTIVAGSPAGTKAHDGAHPISFVDGDDFDLRVDSPGLTGNVAVSASLEGPPPGP